MLWQGPSAGALQPASRPPSSAPTGQLSSLLPQEDSGLFRGLSGRPLPVLLKRIDKIRNLSLEQGQTFGICHWNRHKLVHPHSGTPLSDLKERAVATTRMNLKINAPRPRGCAKKDTRVPPCTCKSRKRTLTCSDKADTFGAGGEAPSLR